MDSKHDSPCKCQQQESSFSRIPEKKMVLLLALVAGFMLDFFWVWCVHSVNKKRPFVAANAAVMFFLCTLVSTIVVVDKNIYAIIIYGIGNWIGTYAAVTLEKRNGRKDT